MSNSSHFWADQPIRALSVTSPGIGYIGSIKTSPVSQVFLGLFLCFFIQSLQSFSCLMRLVIRVKPGVFDWMISIKWRTLLISYHFKRTGIITFEMMPGLICNPQPFQLIQDNSCSAVAPTTADCVLGVRALKRDAVWGERSSVSLPRRNKRFHMKGVELSKLSFVVCFRRMSLWKPPKRATKQETRVRNEMRWKMWSFYFLQDAFG